MEDVASNVFKPVSSTLDVPALEREMAELWRERDTVARYLARNDDSATRFSFLDGPITANNPMGVHHAWGRTYKDLYQRYHTMLGDRQRYQNGFDCQGLWIEVEVERELGFTNKRDIEAYGIDRFVEQCKARVQRFADRITEQSKRLGYWMDWDHSYFTNSDENNYTIWRFLQVCQERRLLYRGHDVMPWCPRCGTGLSNMEIATEGYRELSHLSLTIRLPITTAGHDGESLLVWTTTPWTLSSNVAAAVHPELVYELVAGNRWPALVAQPRLEGPRGTGRGRGPRGEGPGPARPPVPRPVRRAPRPGRRRAPRDRLGRGLRRGGDRHRPHRPGMRRGGLRAVQARRSGGARPDRPVRRVPRGLRLADRALRRRHPGRAGRPGSADRG